jgi:hypothetical protein
MKPYFLIQALALIGIIAMAPVGCEGSNPTERAAANRGTLREGHEGGTPVAAPASSTTATPSTPTESNAKPPTIDISTSPNGEIHIAGKDRWGNKFDTTYENRDFLRNALPVLERSLSADQLAALREEAGFAPEANPARPTDKKPPKPGHP